MTRLNIVPPEELTDQHLFAEFREIKMVPKSLARSLAAAERKGLSLYAFRQRLPKVYTLNTGHVSFFYDKGRYLNDRYAALKLELTNRGVNFNRLSQLDPGGVFSALDHNFNNTYEPTPAAVAIARERIAQRIAARPGWYRHSHSVANTAVPLLEVNGGQLEHLAGVDCWCQPAVDYVDPSTGVTVYVHRSIQ